MEKIHIDVETYSSVDIKKSGHYKYTQSIDFEILILCYAIDDRDVVTVDLASGDKYPEEFIKALKDPKVKKFAHNAAFERASFNAVGLYVPIEQWYCTAVLASYAGLPRSLAEVSLALDLKEFGKKSTGLALIRFFSCPVKPTKTNGQRERNLPKHDPAKWEEFKEYCKWDVIAEREIERKLSSVSIPDFERDIYILDQKINDRGVRIDLDFANNAVDINSMNKKELLGKMQKITGLDNPNSTPQLLSWLRDKTGQENLKSLAKENVSEMLAEAAGPVKQVLQLRQMASKTSVKKYEAMINCHGDDLRARGLFQVYGANRTGRWAGRLIQLQNLPRNYMKDLAYARSLVKDYSFEMLDIEYPNVVDVLSQLIRTSFIPEPGKTFAIVDFSAIEARVTAWLADEKWRLAAFAEGQDIYLVSVAMMFNLDLSKLHKGSPERQTGKIAELALGYQGSVGAMINFGADKMGLSEKEMKRIVLAWRKASPNIVSLWDELNDAAVKCVSLKKTVKTSFKNIVFRYENDSMTIELPSGRKLYYRSAKVGRSRFGSACVKYMGVDQDTGKWTYIDTYGGKLTENIVQAIARDVLAVALLRLEDESFYSVMHVHDEVVAEVFKFKAEKDLKRMEEIMGEPIDWAPGLDLKGDGYTSDFYKKD